MSLGRMEGEVKTDAKESVHGSRRKWLIATSVAGGVAGVATLVPFVDSFAPSEKARAEGAPVTADISTLAPGEMMTVAWRGMPVFLVNRTEGMLADVVKSDDLVADPSTRHPFSMPLPQYCRNEYRSRANHQNLLVVVGVCTHLGCTPRPRFQAGPQANLPDNWPGGFLCPCHGSTYDLAGRVFRNKPAPQNLDVPRYMFVSPVSVLIGQDEQGEA
ncbi:ubiquinol-cytochrome c reductase iron-sulfur subunit [Paraburkholderia sp.]|uniref:ubiquinol-cytochrome c reductase iron-sulfur subunit n=1 Tax=Paraburkholderia sp. TaxID=1926495 RepID=UPI003C767E4D